MAWYGRLVGESDKLHPRHPVDIADALKAPVLGLYGAADTGIPVKTVERMRQALKGAKTPAEIVLYPDPPHGFHADYRPSCRKDKAADGWTRLHRWFQSSLHRGTSAVAIGNGARMYEVREFAGHSDIRTTEL